MVGRKTSREADGQTVPGVTRQVVIKNGSYHATEIVIYADGMIDCWGLVDLDEFERKVRSGWVATEFEDGATISIHHVGSWTMHAPRSWVNADDLIGDVRDTLERLAGRPDSTARCCDALAAYLDETTQDNRKALLAAYLAVPSHLRRYMLGDMDHKDWPVKGLAYGVGGEIGEGTYRQTITESLHEEYLAYCMHQRSTHPDWPRRRQPSESTAETPAVVRVPQAVYPQGVHTAPRIHALRNTYPSSFGLDGVTYPDVETAWYASSVADEGLRAQIVAAPRPYDAMKLAQGAPKRAGWIEARESVMLRLLRAKFTQNPLLAEVLLETSGKAIHYDEFTDSHWDTRGRNWTGRLLELVRAELNQERFGL